MIIQSLFLFAVNKLIIYNLFFITTGDSNDPFFGMHEEHK